MIIDASSLACPASEGNVCEQLALQACAPGAAGGAFSLAGWHDVQHTDACMLCFLLHTRAFQQQFACKLVMEQSHLITQSHVSCSHETSAGDEDMLPQQQEQQSSGTHDEVVDLEWLRMQLGVSADEDANQLDEEEEDSAVKAKFEELKQHLGDPLFPGARITLMQVGMVFFCKVCNQQLAAWYATCIWQHQALAPSAYCRSLCTMGSLLWCLVCGVSNLIFKLVLLPGK